MRQEGGIKGPEENPEHGSGIEEQACDPRRREVCQKEAAGGQ